MKPVVDAMRAISPRTKLDRLDVKKGSRCRNKTMELTRTCRVNPGIGLVHHVDA